MRLGGGGNAQKFPTDPITSLFKLLATRAGMNICSRPAPQSASPNLSSLVRNILVREKENLRLQNGKTPSPFLDFLDARARQWLYSGACPTSVCLRSPIHRGAPDTDSEDLVRTTEISYRRCTTDSVGRSRTRPEVSLADVNTEPQQER